MANIHTDHRDFVITAGSASGGIQLDDFPINGLIVPTLSSTTVELRGSYDGTTYYPVYDTTGTQMLKWTANLGDRIFASRDLADLVGYKYLGVVLGSTQGSDKTFRLLIKRPKVG